MNLNSTRRVALALLSSVAAHASIAGDRSFETELERCLAGPGAVPLQCAHASAMRSPTLRLDVNYTLDLSTGQPGMASFCHYVPGEDFCTLYDCESGPQCLKVGYCFADLSNNQSICVDK